MRVHHMIKHWRRNTKSNKPNSQRCVQQSSLQQEEWTWIFFLIATHRVNLISHINLSENRSTAITIAIVLYAVSFSADTEKMRAHIAIKSEGEKEISIDF